MSANATEESKHLFRFLGILGVGRNLVNSVSTADTTTEKKIKLELNKKKPKTCQKELSFTVLFVFKKLIF